MTQTIRNIRNRREALIPAQDRRLARLPMHDPRLRWIPEDERHFMLEIIGNDGGRWGHNAGYIAISEYQPEEGVEAWHGSVSVDRRYESLEVDGKRRTGFMELAEHLYALGAELADELGITAKYQDDDRPEIVSRRRMQERGND